jgi:hypothetical protein
MYEGKDLLSNVKLPRINRDFIQNLNNDEVSAVATETAIAVLAIHMHCSIVCSCVRLAAASFEIIWGQTFLSATSQPLVHIVLVQDLANPGLLTCFRAVPALLREFDSFLFRHQGCDIDVDTGIPMSDGDDLNVQMDNFATANGFKVLKNNRGPPPDKPNQQTTVCLRRELGFFRYLIFRPQQKSYLCTFGNGRSGKKAVNETRVVVSRTRSVGSSEITCDFSNCFYFQRVGAKDSMSCSRRLLPKAHGT